MFELKQRALELYSSGMTSPTKIAKAIIRDQGLDRDPRSFRKTIEKWINKHKKELSNNKKTTIKSRKQKSESPFVLSAWNDSGYMMDIDQYCEHYKLPRKEIREYKLVSHTGTPFYNILFKEQHESEKVDIDFVREILERETEVTYAYNPTSFNLDKEAVLKWADLHFGAHIRNLMLTHDYDSGILQNGLYKSVEDTNSFGFKKVHVHINGDLIESLSGLNHVNSWLSMNPEETGANAIMLCTATLDRALSKINNLGEIHIVAGNHDRMSKANDEDVKGGAAELIAWGLQLKGYDVKFHPMITRQLVDGIYHINLHGDKVISKRSTKDIIWDYGMKGKYNFVFEAHLHAVIQKLSISERNKFKTIRDDSIDHRRMHLPSFFTGNYYSETLNFLSNSGYVIVWDNGKGLPQLFNGSI